jgi:hypothetical protein
MHPGGDAFRVEIVRLKPGPTHEIPQSNVAAQEIVQLKSTMVVKAVAIKMK